MIKYRILVYNLSISNDNNESDNKTTIIKGFKDDYSRDKNRSFYD